MKITLAKGISFACALGFASIAEAQSTAPLDLTLPASSQQPVALPSDDSSPSDPGKYYGDGTDSESLIDRTTVSGSVTSTVGYSKGYGTGFGTSADINLSTQLKNGNTVNINVGVSRSDGLPISRYGYSGYRFDPRY